MSSRFDVFILFNDSNTRERKRLVVSANVYHCTNGLNHLNFKTAPLTRNPTRYILALLNGITTGVRSILHPKSSIQSSFLSIMTSPLLDPRLSGFIVKNHDHIFSNMTTGRMRLTGLLVNLFKSVPQFVKSKFSQHYLGVTITRKISLTTRVHFHSTPQCLINNGCENKLIP